MFVKTGGRAARTFVAAGSLLLLGLSHPVSLPAQRPDATVRDSNAQRRDTVRNGNTEPGLTAGESEGEPRRRSLLRRTDYNLGFTTLNWGFGFLVDYATYAQDSVSRQQMTVVPDYKLRDARLLVRGRFRRIKRPVTWQMGLMYDGPDAVWRFRQSGIMVAVPEILGSIFVGRAKEGVSLNKVMVGYDGWTMERFTFSDANIPILADGVKYIGHLPSRHLVWNVGWFTDVISKWEAFSSYDNQFTMRVAWLPFVADTAGTLLHVGVNARTGKVNQGSLRLKSRPEAWPAPFFLDTKAFPATSSRTGGLEVYYRPGRVIFGSEYYVLKVAAPNADDPVFHGGDVAITWLVTGETRSYNSEGGYFRAVSPTKTVYQGGPGAWEAVLRFSYSDFDDEAISGGRFWRLTPMLNWHLTDNVRLEMAYGRGILSRFGLKGATEFFQTRLQLQL